MTHLSPLPKIRFPFLCQVYYYLFFTSKRCLPIQVLSLPSKRRCIFTGTFVQPVGARMLLSHHLCIGRSPSKTVLVPRSGAVPFIFISLPLLCFAIIQYTLTGYTNPSPCLQHTTVEMLPPRQSSPWSYLESHPCPTFSGAVHCYSFLLSLA